jgi:hypothetical protein
MIDALTAWKRGLERFSESEYHKAGRSQDDDQMRRFCTYALSTAALIAAETSAIDAPVKRRRRKAASEDIADSIFTGYGFARFVLGTFQDSPSYAPPADSSAVRKAGMIVGHASKFPFDVVTESLTPEAYEELRKTSEAAATMINVRRDLSHKCVVAMVFGGLVTGIQLALAEAELFLPPRVAA